MPPLSTTPVVHQWQGLGGKLIHVENLKSKISWFCPFKTLGRGRAKSRVSFETSIYLKQPNLETKLVSAPSETKHFFRLFCFYIETASFGVSVKPKLTETGMFVSVKPKVKLVR